MEVGLYICLPLLLISPIKVTPESTNPRFCGLLHPQLDGISSFFNECRIHIALPSKLEPLGPVYFPHILSTAEEAKSQRHSLPAKELDVKTCLVLVLVGLEHPFFINRQIESHLNQQVGH